MKIVILNGNTKKSGFIAGALSIVSSYLVSKGIDVQYISLYESDIKDCIGCFNCLKTGQCIVKDDMEKIIDAMKEADGFVIGSPVRNGHTTACYKRFIERITYTLGFTLLLEDKYTLAISSVGYLGGKKINRIFLGLQSIFHTRLSGFLFYKLGGITSKIEPSDVRLEIERATDRFVSDIKTQSKRSIFNRIAFYIDRMAVRKMMLEKYPDTYANVIKCWKEKGYMS
ncbi:MAG TPA: flavodoxin family protein [Syntrophorhabdaceae bacterium]|nr:flavodoxin family protein [Syntrophorhabdaceae bacterium]